MHSSIARGEWRRSPSACFRRSTSHRHPSSRTFDSRSSDCRIRSGSSFKLPGSNTSVTFGGYVKLDAIYSDRTTGVASQGNQFLSPSLIPVGPAAEDHARGRATLHARQSRLFAKTATPTGLGDFTTLVEGDFFGADGNESVSNSNGFRIRHAWGTLGHRSAGQYWTNFMNEAACWGGAVGLGGVVPTGIGKDDLRFDVNAGNAIGRDQELGFFADGCVDDAHRIRLAPTLSGYVAYRHHWTQTLRSSLVLGASHTSGPATASGGLDRSARAEHLNLIWSPVTDVNLGVELINARRETVDGRNGSLIACN